VAAAVVAIGGVVTDGTVTDGTSVVPPPAAEVAEVEPPDAVVEYRRVDRTSPLERPPLWRPEQVSGRLSLS
jgi:hypothetical protein